MKRNLLDLIRSLWLLQDIQSLGVPVYSTFEALEARVFMSGSVLASVVQGNLIINGDAAANVIVLDQEGLNSDQVRITGSDDTTINNQGEPLVLSGITRDIRIQTGINGDDSVIMNNLSAPGSIFIQSKGGNDVLTMNNVDVAVSLRIQNRSGVSTTTVANTQVGKDLMVLSGGSEQHVILQTVEVDGTTKLVSNSRPDSVTIDDSTFHGAVHLYTGNGNDLIQLDSNGDPLGPPTAFEGRVRLFMASGADILQLGVTGQTGNRTTFAGQTVLQGGVGIDIIRNFDASSYNGPSFYVTNFEANTPAPDGTAPAVSFADPALEDADVAVNKKMAVTFSEAMDPLTVSSTTFKLTGPGLTPVAGTVTYVGAIATFTPNANLAPSTLYTGTITTGAHDLSGNALAADFVWTFTTGTIPDTTAPVVSSTDPANNAANVALNKRIAATFSEAMDPLTMTAANMTLTAPGGIPVIGTVTYVGTTMTFRPTSNLAANTTFIATITTGAEDLAGNALANDYVWSFTTGAAEDITAPVVSSTDPANSATGVALNKKIAATFSEAMNPLTITNVTFKLTGPGVTPVAGTVTYVGVTATFTPSSNLAASTTYTATITTGVQDLAGNAMAANSVWTFTTGATPDTTAPTVIATDPLNNEADVALNKAVAATFSEAMDPITITSVNFTLAGPGLTPVAGAVTLVGNTATFTPTSTLAPTTTFTATLSTGVKDLAGNAMASNFVWTFTTGETPDTIAPTVTATNPPDLQPNVAINKTPAATFSESMDPLTITGATFRLARSGDIAVAGTITYDALSKIATFTTPSNLAPNTTYTATIMGGVDGAKDLAGNALLSNKVWTFTTGTQVAQAPINLGAAGPFAVMATSSITSTGPTQINGDVGLNPGSEQGVPPAQVNGTIHVRDEAIMAAQASLLAAYNDAVSRSETSIDLPGNMGGLTFTPGLYTNSTSVLISGAGPGNILTLDAQGDPNAIFIFKMGSTLTTGPGAQIVLAGGAKAGNIYWQVGSSATLDTTTIFKGNILAAVTITVNTGSVVEGRLLGGSNTDGSVTINASTVTVPSA